MPSFSQVQRSLGFAALLAFSLTSYAADPASNPLGSTNITTADPAVPRPFGKPCVVQLFGDTSFVDFSDHLYSYTPSAQCKGKWAKVVLEADFSVTPYVQYDRTASIWLAGVNLYFGTTSEPDGKADQTSWHVERDLTDYTALFKQAGQGRVTLGNVVNSTYTGVIHGSAKLLFYPATFAASAPQVPDAVYPLGNDAIGATATLNTSADTLSATLTLPRNIERAYLDVFTQSQNADEFWYTCVPDQYADEVQECGGGNYREAQISIDGQAAGVAPVYPWIYTGGLSDPDLWRPIPGVQTLNFLPYRVDLSPFAGLLDDGAQHTVAVSVAGASNYFSTTATLLVYQDAQAARLSGAVTRNTLIGQAATPTVSDTLSSTSDGNVSGAITTKLSRHFVIQGYVNTPSGRITNTVDQTVGFDDTQTFTTSDTSYHQITDQVTSVSGTSSSAAFGGLVDRQYRQSFSYPLHVDSDEEVGSDNGITLAEIVHQGLKQRNQTLLFGVPLYNWQVDNAVDSAHTTAYDANFNYLGGSGRQSAQAFAYKDSFGGCYSSTVAAKDGAVSSYADGKGCLGGMNSVYSSSHPDGSPDTAASGLFW